MLQKYMPLIFGFIYLNVAAILNVYFIVSSAIRILTQEILFRKGIVGGPPPPPTAGSDSQAEKRPKTPVVDRTERALPKPKSTAGAGGRNGTGTGTGTGTGSNRKAPNAGKPGTKSPARASTPRKPAGAAGSANGGKAGANGAGPSRTRAKSAGNRNGSNGRIGDGSAADPAPKAHPRSKAKRTRKAR
jgi:hypothetical protein